MSRRPSPIIAFATTPGKEFFPRAYYLPPHVLRASKFLTSESEFPSPLSRLRLFVRNPISYAYPLDMANLRLSLKDLLVIPSMPVSPLASSLYRQVRSSWFPQTRRRSDLGDLALDDPVSAKNTGCIRFLCSAFFFPRFPDDP